ncbi:S-adenosyl-L-methionine-dependent methyltransferase [Favolaschia claudopus]|uniref:DNA (cytosine-5-)-methyltransferase n=1 Tax=Favolaschia claudopus TaxID=2862362 RepID=A0AAV9Z0D6_9AGAR
MLSFADTFLPAYVFSENVVGTIDHSVEDYLTGLPIKNAMLKAICRGLMDIGYQVRIGIVNAAQLGSPQNRYRVVVLAARRGLILPDLPLPTHAAQRPPNYTVSMTEESLPCAVRPSTSLSPHPGVTIQDAIGDMEGTVAAKLDALPYREISKKSTLGGLAMDVSGRLATDTLLLGVSMAEDARNHKGRINSYRPSGAPGLPSRQQPVAVQASLYCSRLACREEKKKKNSGGNMGVAEKWENTEAKIRIQGQEKGEWVVMCWAE